MNKRLRCIAFFVLCIMAVAQLPLVAEEKDHTPVPYTKAEFPLWQRELRRFEILSFGALPFVTLLSFWGYDMIRAAKHPKDPAYYPWPLKQADKAVALTEKEQRKVFFAAVGISVTIALIDITYRAIKRSVEKKRLERENAFTEDPIQFTPITLPFEDEVPTMPLNIVPILSAGSIGGIATLFENNTPIAASSQMSEFPTAMQGRTTGTATR